MATGTTTIVPRTRLSIGIEAALHRELATRARGRVLVVDYFAGRRCGVVTGDLTANFRDQETRGSYLVGTPTEGVRIVVEERLLNVLE